MDFALIFFTLLIGGLGVLWDKPPTAVKVGLVILLLMSAGASAYKAVQDDHDKELLQTLSVAGLSLPNTAYDAVYRRLSEAYGPASRATRCHHTNEGMTCLNAFGNKPLVLNRYEVAQVYADSVRGRDTKDYLNEIRSRKHTFVSDDYKDKLGILGYHVFFDMCENYPDTFIFDDTFGIKILYGDHGKQDVVQIKPEEMRSALPGDAPTLWEHFEALYRERIKAALPQCGGR